MTTRDLALHGNTSQALFRLAGQSLAIERHQASYLEDVCAPKRRNCPNTASRPPSRIHRVLRLCTSRRAVGQCDSRPLLAATRIGNRPCHLKQRNTTNLCPRTPPTAVVGASLRTGRTASSQPNPAACQVARQPVVFVRCALIRRVTRPRLRAGGERSRANDSWAGPTLNMADPSLIPGGSSAGTTTAVAAPARGHPPAREGNRTDSFPLATRQALDDPEQPYRDFLRTTAL